MFLFQKSVLDVVDGYSVTKYSWCNDDTLACHIVKKGYKVNFLDGCNVLQVRMYIGFQECWKE